MLTLTQSSAPDTEPLTLTDAKRQLRVEHALDDEYIQGAIAAARSHIETVTHRQLITATWVLRLDEFPDGEGIIKLPRPPLQSITSVQYVDTAGDSQTLDSSLYTADVYSEPGRLMPAYGQTWPSTRAVPNAVTVTYVAGYGDAWSNIPAQLRAALALIVADLYEHREGQLEARFYDNPTLARLLGGGKFGDMH